MMMIAMHGQRAEGYWQSKLSDDADGGDGSAEGVHSQWTAF